MFSHYFDKSTNELFKQPFLPYHLLYAIISFNIHNGKDSTDGKTEARRSQMTSEVKQEECAKFKSKLAWLQRL